MKRMIYAGVLLGILIFIGIAQAEQGLKPGAISEVSSLKPKDYSGLVGMKGFSETLLKNHFKLYEGYVKNTNTVMTKLNDLLAEGKNQTPEYSELKRRLGWELDGMLLHEYYFENLGGNQPLDPGGPLHKKMAGDFGSYDAWEKDFASTGLMRGIGWVILYWDPRTGKLINAWINEHDVGHIIAAKPLLVMDVFEHAYMPDYQLDKAAYIENFLHNINWKTVAERFKS
jgi:Fe-Mn family superoxide dismutase